MSEPDSSNRSTPRDPTAGDTEAGAASVEGASSSSAADDFGAAEATSRRVLLNWVLPLLLLVCGGAVVWALGAAQAEKRPEPDDSRLGRFKALAPVRVEPVRSLAETGEQLQLKVDGTVVPYREVQIATEVSGEIVFKSDRCEAGTYVEQGELLMRIDPTDYELAVERLKREKEQAYQSLREIDQEMVNTRRLIEVAEQNVELRQREVDRLEKLPAGYASGTELDQAEQALLQAKQERVMQQNQLDLLEKRRGNLEAAEKLAATQLRAARLDLERTEIQAPISGVIVAEDAELNTFVSRGNPIATMEDTSRVEIATKLRMDQLYWILDQAGRDLRPQSGGYDLPETPAVVEYELSGRRGAVYRWQGRLVGYDGLGLDPNSRTVPVRVVVDQPRRETSGKGGEPAGTGPPVLVRGMYVTVRLNIEPTTPLVVLPGRALKPGGRVWQFVPDESVLETSGGGTDAAAERTGGDASAGQDAGHRELSVDASEVAADELSKQLDRPFRPQDWVPGRVFVRDGIVPVDSLSLAGRAARSPSGAASQPERLWVCEATGEALGSGSFVVVSPLSSSHQGDTAGGGGRLAAPSAATSEVLARAPAEAVRAAQRSVPFRPLAVAGRSADRPVVSEEVGPEEPGQ